MTDSNLTIIEARATGWGSRLLALWRHKAFYPFLLKEITMRKVRTTVLGFWWLILRPGIPVAISVVVFTFVIPIETHGLPYAIFLLSGFALWSIFRYTLTLGVRTLMWTRGIMRRTYFPKLLVPIAGIGPPLIEAAVALTFFVGALIYYYVNTGVLYLQPGWNLLWYPVCFALALLFALAFAMVAGVIALFMRDMIFGIRFFAQFMMVATPVFYPVTLLNEEWRWILYINPLTSVVETGRWALTGFGQFHPEYLAISAAAILVFFALCVAFFLRAETYLADEL